MALRVLITDLANPATTVKVFAPGETVECFDVDRPPSTCAVNKEGLYRVYSHLAPEECWEAGLAEHWCDPANGGRVQLESDDLPACSYFYGRRFGPPRFGGA